MPTKWHQSLRLSVWLNQQVAGLETPSTLRGRLAVTSLATVLDHHRAVIVLTRHGLYGSAGALVRNAWEAYVRGVWFHYRASDAELERFARTDQLDKPMHALVEDVERHAGFEEGVLSDVQRKSWRAMNSMAHGGLQLLSRQLSGDTLWPSFSQDEIDNALDSVNGYALLATLAIADIAGKLALQSEILEWSRALVGV